jgi:hypothetical protein
MNPTPVDSSGYTRILGSDVLGTTTVSWDLTRTAGCTIPIDFKSVAVGFDTQTRSFATSNVGSVRWDFGDGTTGTGAATSNIYPAAGEFLVTMSGQAGGSGADCIAWHWVTANPVRAYRPNVWLVGDEKFFPGDPNIFVGNSRLEYDKPDFPGSELSNSCDDIVLAPTTIGKTVTPLNPLRLGAFAAGNPYTSNEWVRSKVKCAKTSSVLRVNAYLDSR